MDIEKEYELTGNLALAMVSHSQRCIGPNGTIIQIPEGEQAHDLRKSYIGQLAVAAMDLLELQKTHEEKN